MKKIFNYLLNKFKYETYEAHVVIEPELLEQFYKSVINSVFTENRHTISKDQLIGDKPTEYNGQGMDYSESKPYTAGDDTRSINWKQTAKTGELITNKYYHESENIDYILLDQRQCMFYGTRVQTKLSTAIKIAMIFSVKSINNNKKVKIISISDKISVSGIIDTNEKVLVFFSAIAKNNLSESEPHQQKISTLIRYMQSLSPLHSSISIISDFHDFSETALKLVRSLASKNHINITQVQDPVEKELPMMLPVNYQSLSRDRSITVSTTSELNQLNKIIESANSRIETLLSNTGIIIQKANNQLADEDLLNRKVA